MIKFIAVALIAIVVVGQVSANDEAEMEQETSLLMGDQRQFAEFCMAERNYVKSDIKSRMNKQSSEIYKLFFNSFFVEIGDEVLEVTRDAVAKFAENIVEPPSTQTAPAGPISEKELQQRVDDTVNALTPKVRPGVFGRLCAGATGTAQTAVHTIRSAFFVRLTKLRAMMTKENFLQGFVDACKQVGEYEQRLIADLEVEKAKMLQSVKEPEMEKFIKATQIKSLPCQTSRYISRLNGACTLLIGGTNYFLKMLGVDAKVDFPTPSA